MWKQRWPRVAALRVAAANRSAVAECDLLVDGRNVSRDVLGEEENAVFRADTGVAVISAARLPDVRALGQVLADRLWLQMTDLTQAESGPLTRCHLNRSTQHRH